MSFSRLICTTSARLHTSSLSFRNTLNKSVDMCKELKTRVLRLSDDLNTHTHGNVSHVLLQQLIVSRVIFYEPNWNDHVSEEIGLWCTVMIWCSSEPKVSVRVREQAARVCHSLVVWFHVNTDVTEVLKSTVMALKAGQVVAVPTDTIYGLACVAQNSEAVRRVYDIKGRNGDKPLAICVGEIQDIYRSVNISCFSFLNKILLIMSTLTKTAIAWRWLEMCTHKAFRHFFHRFKMSNVIVLKKQSTWCFEWDDTKRLKWRKLFMVETK